EPPARADDDVRDNLAHRLVGLGRVTTDEARLAERLEIAPVRPKSLERAQPVDRSGRHDQHALGQNETSTDPRTYNRAATYGSRQDHPAWLLPRRGEGDQHRAGAGALGRRADLRARPARPQPPRAGRPRVARRRAGRRAESA